MSHRNYSKFSEKKEEPEMITAEIKQEVIEEPKSEEIVKPTIGTVTNCNSLYVRKEPTVNSESLSIIEEFAKVEINLEKSTEDFYKVKTSNDVEGYCMKKFITIE